MDHEFHWVTESLTESTNICSLNKGIPSGSAVKNQSAMQQMQEIPGSGGSPGGGHGNPLQYSCQENPMDRGTWQARVHGIAKSQT